MRFGRYALVFALVLSFSGTAFAQKGGKPAAGKTYSAGTNQGGNAGKWSKKHDAPNLNSKEGSTLPGSRTTVNGASKNSDPVVAADKNGRLYDKRNGQKLSEAKSNDAMDRADAYNRPKGVTLGEWKLNDGKPAAVGLNAGPFKDGRADLLGGGKDDPGRLSIDVLRAEGSGGAKVLALENGYGAQAELKGQATLIGINGEIKGQYGDAMNNVNGSAKGQAYIGANGELSTSGQITTDGVQANGKAGVFVGGKVEGEIAGGFVICGVAIGAKGTGEASYGIGAEAEGYFKVNWSTMTVKIGGKAAATFGGGAGVGGEVEISLAELMKDPSMSAKCAFDGIKKAGEFVITKGGELVDGAIALGNQGLQKLDEAATAVSNTVGNTVDSIGNGLSNAGNAISCFFGGCKKDKPPAPQPSAVAVATNNNYGNNVPRNWPTAAAAIPTNGSGGTSQGVGITR